MLPFNPHSELTLWWTAWRNHCKNMRRYPAEAWEYSQAALIAQGAYVMTLAIELNKEKSK